MVVLEKPINFDSEGWTEPLTDVEEISRAEKAGKLVMATFYLCASCGLAVIDDEYTDALEQM